MTDIFKDEGAEQFSAGEPRQESYYEILEVAPDASRIQIREAYIRLKNTFSGNNQVLYSLISEDEARRSLEHLEEAYRILDDEMLRRDYDRSLRVEGVKKQPDSNMEARDPFASTEGTNKNGAIGRPHELAFLGASDSDQESHDISTLRSSFNESEDFWATASETPVQPEAKKRQVGFAKAKRFAAKAFDGALQERVRSYIEAHEVYDGAFLAGLRDIFDISQNELQERTKISYQYIKALEGNDIENLPSMVYVKGFLKMYLQYLGVQKEAAGIIESYIKSVQDCQKESSN